MPEHGSNRPQTPGEGARCPHCHIAYTAGVPHRCPRSLEDFERAAIDRETAGLRNIVEDTMANPNRIPGMDPPDPRYDPSMVTVTLTRDEARELHVLAASSERCDHLAHGEAALAKLREALGEDDA